MRNPSMNFIFIFKHMRSKPMLKLNEILNQIVLKDNKGGNKYL